MWQSLPRANESTIVRVGYNAKNELITLLIALFALTEITERKKNTPLTNNFLSGQKTDERRIQETPDRLFLLAGITYRFYRSIHSIM